MVGHVLAWRNVFEELPFLVAKPRYTLQA